MQNIKNEIRILLTEIISDYKIHDMDVANDKFDEHLGTELFKKEMPYILSSDVLCILSSKMRTKTDSKAFYNELYSVCNSKGIETKILYDDEEDGFFIHLLD